MMNHLSGDKCTKILDDLIYLDWESKCYEMCQRELLNITNGCLPVLNTPGFIYHINLDDFKDKHIYSFCKMVHDPNIIEIDAFTETCLRQCRPLTSCKLPLFDVYHYTSGESIKGKTEINIIPKNNHQLDYNEKSKFTLNDLFYKCGGIVGMWLGWSVVRVTIHTGLASILLDLTISGRVLDECNQVPLSVLDSKFQKSDQNIMIFLTN